MILDRRDSNQIDRRDSNQIVKVLEPLMIILEPLMIILRFETEDNLGIFLRVNLRVEKVRATKVSKMVKIRWKMVRTRPVKKVEPNGTWTELNETNYKFQKMIVIQNPNLRRNFIASRKLLVLRKTLWIHSLIPKVIRIEKVHSKKIYLVFLWSRWNLG